MSELAGWSSSAMLAAAGGLVVAVGVAAYVLSARRRDGLDEIHRPRLPRGDRRRVRARLGKVVS